jgi:Transglycosylase SLT domain
MIEVARVCAAVAAGVVALVGTARADILVMQGGDGRLLITNQGQRSGYKVISRHREFFGSSGMGLYASVAGDSSKYEDTVLETSKRYALEPSLVKAVIRAESNFQPMAVSPKGAMGLMQLMPDTARMHEVRNAFDPTQNIHGGVRHLRYLMDRYGGNLDLVLSAYNAGTKPVDLVRGIPNIPETQEYVRRVRFFRAVYKNGEAKPAPAVKAPLVARVDLTGKTIDQVYGVPIVLRDLRTRR